jgi:hypothetical protein
MKYAFVLASNVYISHEPVISYADNNSQTEILRITSYKPHKKHDQHHTALAIDANIFLEGGQPLKITGNSFDNAAGHQVNTTDDILSLNKSGEVVFEVHQFPEEDFSSLQSHIYNEIEAQGVDIVFIVRGNFWVDGHHIIIDNEKLFIDEDSYATGVTNNHEGVLLSPYSVRS